MKNLLLCLLLVFFCASCEVETAKFESTHPLPEAVTLGQRSLTDSLSNSNNPYDYCGQLFLELHQAYFVGVRDSLALDALVLAVERVSEESAGFTAIKPRVYQAPLPERVRYFVTSKDSCLTTVLDGSGLSEAAASSFNAFVLEYLSLCASSADYPSIYSFVYHYEATVLGDLRFNAFDQKVLLISSSVARYSAAAKKKRPKKNTDPAWEFLICGIYGSLEGAASSPAEAVTLALAAAIAENQ
ncbi:hypothetical protein [Flavobacterium sp. SM2513]|uniref:hypothetical protein n=1 Tax=Flavobacterium sp. SM2513 TaxID=3424766 RepID=UPI003D7F5F49